MTGAESALPRYFKVVRGEEKPLRKLLKKIPCKKTNTLNSMWKEHDQAMKQYRKERNNEFSRIRNLPDANFSLLDLKHDISLELLKSCIFCERKCKINRAQGEKGWCRVSAESHVATMFEHFGEESFLVPSATIFFTGCTWACCYCQNWDISQFPERGKPISGLEVAQWIDQKAESKQIINANFVGGEPTPNLHTILDAINRCKTDTAMIWNSNMYMSEETTRLLEGAIDAYLADFRYGNNECAMRLSNTPKYWETITRNFLLTGKAAELIIRILVLPNHVEDDAKPILKWIGQNLSDKAYVNLMRQYYPRYKAHEFKDIARPLKPDEFDEAAGYLKKYGIKYYEIQ
jgi:putative pyruvate formate lyase activating enzyme